MRPSEQQSDQPVGRSGGAIPKSNRWLKQTLAGGGHVPPQQRGNCVPACIASVLGLPLHAIANTHGEGWWERLQAECANVGYCLAQLDMQMAPPPAYWLATLPSLNLPDDPDGKRAWHTVVAWGDRLVHDPSTGRCYDDESWTRAWDHEDPEQRIVEGWVLLPIDPLRFAA